MKHKISSIIITAFLLIFCGMYVFNYGVSVVDECKENGTNISSVKRIILKNRDNDAQCTPFRKTYVNLNGAYHTALDKKFVYDAHAQVAKLNNGYLTFATTAENDTDLIPYAEKTIRFKDELKKENIEFLYVQAPEKVCRYDGEDVLPPGIHSGYSDVIPFLEELEKGGVNFIDLEERLHEDGHDHYDMFYKTDHHWNARAGFWANSIICEYLNDNYGFTSGSDLLDEGLYTFEKYEDAFIGTQGSRVGVVFSPVDDFEMITPNFNTDFTVVSDGEEKTGSFKDTMLYMEAFSSEAVLSDKDYVVFSGGDFALQTVVNRNADPEKKIVIIRDSFARVVTPFLALQCGELHILDLRYYDEMSAMEYAKSIDADLVIVMYNPGMFPEKNTFEFFGNEDK